MLQVQIPMSKAAGCTRVATRILAFLSRELIDAEHEMEAFFLVYLLSIFLQAPKESFVNQDEASLSFLP